MKECVWKSALSVNCCWRLRQRNLWAGWVSQLVISLARLGLLSLFPSFLLSLWPGKGPNDLGTPSVT